MRPILLHRIKPSHYHKARDHADPANARTTAVSEPRIKAKLWVQMALRLGDIEGQPGMVLRKGDPDSGGILVILRGRDGLCVLSQVRTSEEQVSWMRATGVSPVNQTLADAYIDRQVGRDPDLWVVEFECQNLQPPFEARIVS